MRNEKTYQRKANMSRELAKLIYEWHSIHVPLIKTGSIHTLRAYRTSLTIFMRFLMEEKSITPFTLSIDCFSVACLDEWRMWLIRTHGVKNDTCNIRMAAIKGLLEYIGGRAPYYAYLYIAATEHIKPMRTAKVKVYGMSRAAVKALFAEPDTETHIGIRDLVLMMLNYGVAGRINEILSLKLTHVHLEAESPYVTLHGKGGIYRSIYLQEDIVKWIRLYMNIYHDCQSSKEDYLFYSPCGGYRGMLTQPAVAKRLKIYAERAHKKCPDVPLNLHSHLWRHSMACHWREDNINIVEIKELLGHKCLESTMVYQDVTEQQKKEALSTLEDTITKAMPKKWKSAANKDLITYLGL
jgi:integrase/recombinase XerD